MIEEAYVSFETAKLLKEKGFNEPCFSYYLTTKTLHTSFHNRVHVEDEPHFNCLNIENAYDIKDKSLFEDICSAPTLQRAMKWLRIEHNIHIEPHIVKTKYSYGYMPNYIDLKELKQHFPFDEFDFSDADKYVCITYDNACEAAIKYCLKNLI